MFKTTKDILSNTVLSYIYPALLPFGDQKVGLFEKVTSLKSGYMGYLQCNHQPTHAKQQQTRGTVYGMTQFLSIP